MPTPSGLSPDSLHAELLALFELPTAERSLRLAALCERHPADATMLRRVVEQVCDPATQGAATVALAVPEQIGPFRRLSHLGTGGMGSVWLAERTELRQLVAIKLVDRAGGGPAVLARFQREQAALARMNHDAIAKVFDVGCLPDGRPWLAMEYVPGDNLLAWCDRRQATVRQRIELLLLVCSAVEHAHQKGVIHRDLKPGNILVAEVGGRPTVKVIDFGLVRDDLDVAGGPKLTAVDAFLGTPEYMPPEQADGGHGVDTRSDIYSLGVTAYELLCGALPFRSEELRHVPISELLRRLRDEEPRRASAQVGDEPEVAAARGTTVRGLVATLRRELDWVLMRAMAKEPARRYPTVGALAADLRAYLEFRPVAARPPSVTYRLTKWVRRHRAAVAAAAMLAVALAGGSAVVAHERRLHLDEQRRHDIEQTMTSARQALANQAFSEALSQLRRVAELAIDPAEVDAVGVGLLRLRALEALGRYDEARAIENELLRCEPTGVHATDLWILRGLGAATSADGRAAFQAILDRAAAAPEAVSREDRLFAEAMVTGSLDEAEMALRDVLASKWDHLPALKMIGPVLAVQGKAREGQRFAEQWRSVSPGDVNPDFLCALLHAVCGDAVPAATRDRLTERVPGVAALLASIGRVLRILDQLAHQQIAAALSEHAPAAGPVSASGRERGFEAQQLRNANMVASAIPEIGKIFGFARKRAGTRSALGESRAALAIAPILRDRYAAVFKPELFGSLPGVLAALSLVRDLPERAARIVGDLDGSSEQMNAILEVNGVTANLPGVDAASRALVWMEVLKARATERNAKNVWYPISMTEALPEIIAWVRSSATGEDDLHDMLAMLWWAGTADIGTISDQVLAVWAQRFGQTRRWRRVTAEILARRDTRAEAIEQLQHPDLANDPKAQALLTKLRGQ